MIHIPLNSELFIPSFPIIWEVKKVKIRLKKKNLQHLQTKDSSCPFPLGKMPLGSD